MEGKLFPPQRPQTNYSVVPYFCLRIVSTDRRSGGRGGGGIRSLLFRTPPCFTHCRESESRHLTEKSRPVRYATGDQKPKILRYGLLSLQKSLPWYYY